MLVQQGVWEDEAGAIVTIMSVVYDSSSCSGCLVPGWQVGAVPSEGMGVGALPDALHPKAWAASFFASKLVLSLSAG